MGKWKGNTKNSRDFDRRKHGGEERVVAGSFTLESVKESAAWGSRVEFKNAPKRNWALCFGYIGSKYQGLQMNPNCNSVERHLERALLLAGGIQEVNFGNLNRIHWSRAARTDKGVHANAQCIAVKLAVHKGDEGSDEERSSARRVFVSKVNEFLPSDIHLHHITKVTKKFNAKNFCGSRTYHYLLPSYACISKVSMKADLDSVNGNVKELQALNCIKSYRINEERKTELETALGCFVGTFKFHNFTSGKTSSDGDVCRYIKKFTIIDAVADPESGVEWLVLEVHGQSFLYNQIRKMVGAALQVIGGELTVEALKSTFLETEARNPTVPIAPGIGLYLHEMEYDGYNKKVGMLNSSDEARLLKTVSTALDLEEGAAEKKQKDGDNSEEKAVDTSNINTNNNDKKEDEEEGASARDVLDLSCTRDMADFQRTIWQHVMAEEDKESHFLLYLVGTTTRQREDDVQDE